MHHPHGHLIDVEHPHLPREHDGLVGGVAAAPFAADAAPPCPPPVRERVWTGAVALEGCGGMSTPH